MPAAASFCKELASAYAADLCGVITVWAGEVCGCTRTQDDPRHTKRPQRKCIPGCLVEMDVRAKTLLCAKASLPQIRKLGRDGSLAPVFGVIG